MHFPTKFQFSKQSLEQWADTPLSSNKRRNLVKQQEVTDTKDNWLKAIRYPSGKVVLYLKGQFQHQTYRIRLGEHPSLNVVNARKRVNEIRNLLYAGKDPSIELKKANMTLAKLADEYVRYERQRGKKSIKSDESRLKHHLLPKFGKRLISTMTRKEVEQYHCELSAAKSASLANRILSLI